MREENAGLEWLKYWAEELGEYEIRDYSGRCMYGSRCPGITTPNALETYHNMVMDLVQQDPEDWDQAAVLESLGAPAVDAMGLEQILYFPDCPWEDESEEDEDSKEDPEANLEDEE